MSDATDIFGGDGTITTTQSLDSIEALRIAFLYITILGTVQRVPNTVPPLCQRPPKAHMIDSVDILLVKYCTILEPYKREAEEQDGV